ncbi:MULTISPECIES: N4-gp56 family major capsid protein [unclassified Methylobacterium]|jgi:N4-gp56 family major capsid protein|uniref:N4-gp56 family major capsid protein n=1 Tax=unclassified Methylobacterium TaxID=2615210 RepID=UPI0005BD1439|nr:MULTISPECIES: N4-gp56 family major capsid protein [unclassified Methylobacterium]SFV11689.1 major capsid protein, N4-gp56 family [Methylobacterium sp. UNCCL125]
MGVTAYALNDALAAKLWSKSLSVEATKALDIAPLFGESAKSVIQIKTETQKGVGDKVTFGLRMQLAGNGFTSSDRAEGNGEQLSTMSDAITIDELGNVVGIRSKFTIDQQRVPFNLRDEAKDGLSDWFQLRTSVSFFNHACGFTPANVVQVDGSGGVKFTGNNVVTAATRVIRPNGKANDGALGAGDGLTLAQIDAAVEIAKTGGAAGAPKMRPVKIDGMGEMWVMYIHPTQVTQLRINAGAGQWLDIQKAAMQGGEITKNPIFDGSLGVYNNVILRESQQVTLGVAPDGKTILPNVRRAVLLGAQAVTAAFGKGGGPEKFRWNEELYDHKRELEVSAWAIWGIKKTTYNGVDFAVIVIPTYAVNAG